MVEHTPGPWKVFWGKRKRHMFIGIGTEAGDGITDPHFGLWRGDSEEAAANARLIAAAPDLLKALKDILECPTIQSACGWYHEMKDARAAVAKAAGDPPDRRAPAIAGAALTPIFNPFVLSVACRASSFPIQEDVMLPDLATFLPGHERFHFSASRSSGDFEWLLAILLVLNFAIVAGVAVIAWRFFHG